MAAVSSLREYQSNILARLEQAKEAGSELSIGYLGVVVGGTHLLISMTDITETLPLMEVYTVPLVKPWFMGVSNVRGVLYAINDLSSLVFDQGAQLTSASRVVLLQNEVASHVGFVVDRLVGLRKLEDMQIEKLDQVLGIGIKQECYADDANQLWYVMDFRTLINDKVFKQSN
jgi:twitching motility protein PilI